MVQALLSEDKSLFGNPWREDQWNITVQGKFVARYGEAKAREFAKAAGTTFGAVRPRGAVGPTGQYAPIPKSNFTVIVQKKGTVVSGGGGLVGAGSSGSGKPTG